jgi:hypothetical protein
MENLKQNYIKLLILHDEISSFHTKLNEELDFVEKLRLFRCNFVVLKNFQDSLSNFNFIIKNHPELQIIRKDLQKRLEFINHLRNKIKAHLDMKIIDKLVEWEPVIFKDMMKEEKYKKTQLMFIYKSLLESGINSYIDENSNHKVFDFEIDLMLPSNQTVFFNYIGKLNFDSINFLESTLLLVEKNIVFLDNENFLKASLAAGRTNFNLKE